MEDGPVPVLPWHLYLGEVGAVHLNNSLQGAFDETVGALSLGGSRDDLGLVFVDSLEAFSPHGFTVEVSMESAGGVANVCAELGEGVDDII